MFGVLLHDNPYSRRNWKGNEMTNNILDKFDPYAMVTPKSRDDLYLLACELKAELENLAHHLQNAANLCEQNKGTK